MPCPMCYCTFLIWNKVGLVRFIFRFRPCLKVYAFMCNIKLTDYVKFR